MAHFTAAVKTDWKPDPEGLLQHARGIAVTAAAQPEAARIADEQALAIVGDNKQAELRTLSPEKQALLLAGCISPLPLHKTLVLLDAINARRDDRYYHHELIALAKALVYSSSNLHFGPEVGVGAVKTDAAVMSTWLNGVASTSFQRTIIV